MIDIYSNIIINWYLQNKRDLPWRNTTDPYKIWISEVILQQTRVNQGLDYYLRFIERFPNIEALANADEDEVLKFWQGLGYYSRARNLHVASKEIMSKYAGRYPNEYKDIITLKGVGEYTAAAIASFAYNLPYAAVDGNVYRVLSRLFEIDTPIDSNKGKKQFGELAQEILSKTQPGLHNQAMMEFGALHCTPASPSCRNCPIQVNCKAFENNRIQDFPVKSQKTKITNRYFNYLFIDQDNQYTYLQKRTKNDVWKNLYEFPLIETEGLMSVEELINNEEFNKLFPKYTEITISDSYKTIKHILSHRNIFARFFSIKMDIENTSLKNYIKVPLKELDNYAVSRLIELFMESLENKQNELVFD